MAFSSRAARAALSLLLMGGAIVGCGNSGSGGDGSQGTGTGGNGATGADLATPAPLDMATPVPSDMAMPSTGPADLANPASAPDLTMVTDATKFLGTWIYGTGATATTDCPGQTPSTDISANTFTVTLKSGNTITLSAGAALACTIDFTVAGNTATIVPGQMCTVTQNGTTATVKPNKGGTFLTSDGTTAQLSATAVVSASIVQCNAGIAAMSAHR
jgi:hypothetical protein